MVNDTTFYIQKKYIALKTSGALWGSQAQRPFSPPFLVGKTPAIMTFHEFQRVDLNSCKSREQQPRNHLRQD